MSFGTYIFKSNVPRVSFGLAETFCLKYFLSHIPLGNCIKHGRIFLLNGPFSVFNNFSSIIKFRSYGKFYEILLTSDYLVEYSMLTVSYTDSLLVFFRRDKEFHVRDSM